MLHGLLRNAKRTVSDTANEKRRVVYITRTNARNVHADALHYTQLISIRQAASRSRHGISGLASLPQVSVLIEVPKVPFTATSRITITFFIFTLTIFTLRNFAFRLIGQKRLYTYLEEPTVFMGPLGQLKFESECGIIYRTN